MFASKAVYLASEQKAIHIVHSDRAPTTLESETLYDTLSKQKAIALNADRTHPHSLVATSIDVQVLPHNKLDKAAFAGAVVLTVAFLPIVQVLHQSILIRQSSVMAWGYDGAKENPKTVPIEYESLTGLRSLYDSTHSLVEIVPGNARNSRRDAAQRERSSLLIALVVLGSRLAQQCQVYLRST